MDPSHFDDLTRVLSTAGARRPLLRALLGAVLGGAVADAAATKRAKARRKGRDGDTVPDSGQRLDAEGRGRGKSGKRKSKKKRGRGNGGGQAPPPPECCGTEACSPPERGSTSSGCDFAGQSFAGQDLNGSIFRGIDGRGTNFNQTLNHGSIFAEACLQGATFRRARLDGSTWGGACLFGADFTGADFRGDLALFDNALFCDTVMPDGNVNDRDCAEATPCCQPSPDPGPACQTAADCADQPCQTKACQNGACVYDEVFTGPSPNGLCTFCCDGDCCLSPANQCNPENSCCAPNCEGRVCGPDGCGGDGTCGPCSVQAGRRCTPAGQCVCDAISCPNGCCDANADCWPGDSNARCGPPGGTCATCTGQDACRNGRCVCQPACANRQCGADGCGGSCGSCPDGQRCVNGRCGCDAQSCPDGCCDANDVCQSGTANPACGSDGAACQACGGGTECLNQQCGTCPTLTCEELGFECGSQSNRCGGTLQCGRCPLGATPSCQNGECRACPAVCPASCGVCVQLLDGTTRCGGSVDIGCNFNCSANADCDAEYPTCAVSSVGRGSGEILDLPDLCRIPQSPGVCVAIRPCCTPDCAGKTCGPDGCNGSCGACGPCEVCDNGACRPLRPNGAACDRDSECCSENCFGGVCANSATECVNSGPCNPPAKGCVAGFCCSCASPDDCCAGQCCGDGQFCCNQQTCCFNAQVCNGGECIG